LVKILDWQIKGDGMREEQIIDLKNEVARLSIKLETLVDHLNVRREFGPHMGEMLTTRW
jgi:hypothetical protein